MNFLVLVALSGLAISLYFALVDSGRLRPDTPIVPSFCRLDERRCGVVLRHPHARLLGIPNYGAGIGYYILLLVREAVPFPPPWDAALVVVSWCVVAAGVFLAYSLLAIIRVACPLCLAIHGLNLLLALIISFSI